MKKKVQVETFTFEYAIQSLKEGAKVAREGWNGKSMYIALQKPTKTSKMTLPYIYMKTVDGNLVPWSASQSDTMVADWYIVN